MGAAAVKAAKAIDYHSTGTVEFLLDEDGKFYFMEMNTRIQVEHPVTELVTDVDLIKEQIRVAAGEKHSLPNNEPPAMRGHALECRINAEDPAKNFQPSPGRIDIWHAPGGPGVRVDSHAYQGYHVPPFYDSLLAKLIVHGRDRQESIIRMRLALESFIVEGVKTTIPFLLELLEDPDVVAGNIDTKFLERRAAAKAAAADS
jgi:acetyl-CoA carboxylase biotin carboxylase subunit